MGLFKKILVPVDGSRYSLNAVCLAARLGRIHGSELRVFHVIDETLLDQLARFSDQAFLNDMRCEAHQEIVTTSQVIIREGVPHEVILEEALSWGADLIVMGKLGRRGIAHILLGSVAERVIEFSEIPVLIVK
jgi:nucleotide-binding universal stress UspA family protein